LWTNKTASSDLGLGKHIRQQQRPTYDESLLALFSTVSFQMVQSPGPETKNGVKIKCIHHPSEKGSDIKQIRSRQ
jgi:hypothetical protein